MPVQYPLGVKKSTYTLVMPTVFFDVSHMGATSSSWRERSCCLRIFGSCQILLTFLQGKQRYAFFTNEQGGIMDDLMVC
ncbi:hypothetical protein O9929_25890 [Vibrio lentus]|nr:hypothetical protein [Vibrio lentus]